MTLKNWQTNKKSNTAQKKGSNKAKPVAKKLANAKKPEPTAQVAEPHHEAAPAPEAVEMVEHADPHASKEPADEVLVIYEPTETDGAATETAELSAEEVEVEQVEVERVEPGADETALANTLEAEAATAEPAPAIEPTQHGPAAAEPEAEAVVMATPEEMQVADETQVADPACAPPWRRSRPPSNPLTKKHRLSPMAAR